MKDGVWLEWSRGDEGSRKEERQVCQEVLHSSLEIGTEGKERSPQVACYKVKARRLEDLKQSTGRRLKIVYQIP